KLQTPAAMVHTPADRASRPRKTVMPLVANSRKVKVSAELTIKKATTENSAARTPRNANNHQFLMSVLIMSYLVHPQRSKCVTLKSQQGVSLIITLLASAARREPLGR